MAHSLQALSVVCQGVRGVTILLVLREVPQTLGYCFDNDPIGVRNGLEGDQHAINKKQVDLNSTSTSLIALSLNEHRATSTLLTNRLTSMSLG